MKISEKKAKQALVDLKKVRQTVLNVEAQKAERLAEVSEEFNEQLSKLNDQVADCEAVLQSYADQNLKANLGEMSTMYGRVGYREGNDKVVLKEGKQLKKVLAALQENAPQFLSNKVSLNKRAILGHKDNEEAIKTLSKAGVQVVRESIFYLETSE